MKRRRVSKPIVQQPVAQFYERFVESIKQRIRVAQIKAARAAKNFAESDAIRAELTAGR